MADRKLFNKTVYTPMSEALRLLEERRNNPELMAKVEKLFTGEIPEPLKKEKMYGVQARQIATPNYDTCWFLELTKSNGLTPVFLEYYDDKFTSNNDFKYSLGILRIHEKINKKGEDIEEKINIVNFSKDDGKKIKDISTISGESLTNFHHNLFKALNLQIDEKSFYDNSIWFNKMGGKASSYYYNFLLLFICHGILFENFLFEDGKDFTKKIFLPSLEKVSIATGMKPLIVPIPPMDNEDDSHWFSYNKIIKEYIKK